MCAPHALGLGDPFLFGIIQLGGIPQIDERLDAFGHARLDESLSLAFRVEFDTEENCDIRDPQPNQEDDDRGQ
jgi:hypothetical protein